MSEQVRRAKRGSKAEEFKQLHEDVAQFLEDYRELRGAAIALVERKGNYQCEYYRRLMRALGGYGANAEEAQ